MTDLPPLLLARDRVLHGLTPNDLAKRVKAGSLVRVRHGVYTDGKVWKGLKPWEQYRLRVQAAAETFEKPTVFARHSAASVWGIPTIGLNHPVQAITMKNALSWTWRRSRLSPRLSRPWTMCFDQTGPCGCLP